MNVYEVPAVSPVKVMDEPADAVWVVVAGDDFTEYVVMVLPLLLGTVHAIVAVVLLSAVAVMLVGTPGIAAGVTLDVEVE